MIVKVTKRQAVQALIRSAMRAVDEGEEIGALTLAGAAEGAMPPTDDLTAFQFLKSIHQWFRGSTDKQAADVMNEERNWLKHYNVGEPDSMEITMSMMMLLRAITRYASVYGFDDLTREFGAFMGWPSDSEWSSQPDTPPPAASASLK